MTKSDPIETIERDLSTSRANLKDNVHALSEKLTLGKIVDELVFDSKINWDSVGGKTADTMKSVIPGAVLGAGVALLLANGGLSPVFGTTRQDSTDGKGRSGYEPGYDPVADWRTEATDREIEASQDDLKRRPNEDETAHKARWAEGHARLLGHRRNHDEDDHAFHARIDAAVGKVKEAAAGARDRLTRAAGEAKHGVQDAFSSVAHTASAGTAAAGQALHAGMDVARAQGAKANDAMKEGKARVEAMYVDNPVLGLAVGIGIGALLGALTPMSRQEEKLLSRPVNKATLAAAHLGAHAMDKMDGKAGEALKTAGAPVQGSEAPITERAF
jgi:hypothetical protein